MSNASLPFLYAESQMSTMFFFVYVAHGENIVFEVVALHVDKLDVFLGDFVDIVKPKPNTFVFDLGFTYRFIDNTFVNFYLTFQRLPTFSK